MTHYELEVRPVDGADVAVVAVVGELDLTNTAEVERGVQEAVNGRGALVLDLNRVTFIDSAALHMLFRLARRGANDRLGIVLEPTALVARTLTIVGLDEVADVRQSLDELLDARR